MAGIPLYIMVVDKMLASQSNAGNLGFESQVLRR